MIYFCFILLDKIKIVFSRGLFEIWIIISIQAMMQRYFISLVLIYFFLQVFNLFFLNKFDIKLTYLKILFLNYSCKIFCSNIDYLISNKLNLNCLLFIWFNIWKFKKRQKFNLSIFHSVSALHFLYSFFKKYLIK